MMEKSENVGKEIGLYQSVTGDRNNRKCLFAYGLWRGYTFSSSFSWTGGLCNIPSIWFSSLLPIREELLRGIEGSSLEKEGRCLCLAHLTPHPLQTISTSRQLHQTSSARKKPPRGGHSSPIMCREICCFYPSNGSLRMSLYQDHRHTVTFQRQDVHTR